MTRHFGDTHEQQGDLEHLDDILKIVRETGALDLARASAMAEANRAIEAARQLPCNAYQEGRVQLAAALQERRS